MKRPQQTELEMFTLEPERSTQQRTSKPAVQYWAEHDALTGCWIVYAQVEGYPATEACDDWFANEADAQAMAKQLATEHGKTL